MRLSQGHRAGSPAGSGDRGPAGAGAVPGVVTVERLDRIILRSSPAGPGPLQ